LIKPPIRISLTRSIQELPSRFGQFSLVTTHQRSEAARRFSLWLISETNGAANTKDTKDDNKET
jgi:hypothetical protein